MMSWLHRRTIFEAALASFLRVVTLSRQVMYGIATALDRILRIIFEQASFAAYLLGMPKTSFLPLCDKWSVRGQG